MIIGIENVFFEKLKMYPRRSSGFTIYGYFSIAILFLFVYPFEKQKDKWCYAEIEIPAKYKTIEENTLKPNENKSQKEKVLIRRKEIKAFPILCEKDLTKYRLNKIRKALQERGYITNNEQVSEADQLLIPLSLYQKENKLEIGYFSVESLKELEVDLWFLYLKKGNFICYEKNYIQDKYVSTMDTIKSHAGVSVIHRRELIEKGGYTRYEPCLCEKDLTKMKIREIKRRLDEKGYEVEEINGINYIQLQSAFVKFQRDNKLPLGRLNFKTLEALDVDY